MQAHNLRYGVDNWIYGTVGTHWFNGEVVEKFNFGSGTFRFKSDGSKMEFSISSTTTLGESDSTSRVMFGSTANNNPSFLEGFWIASIGRKENDGEDDYRVPSLFPITPNIRQVDAFNNHTAACGLLLPHLPDFCIRQNRRALFADRPYHLLGMYDIERKGSGFGSTNAFSLVASADEWFSPIGGGRSRWISLVCGLV